MIDLITEADWDYVLSSLEPLSALKEEPQILQRLTDLRRIDSH